MNIPNYPIPDPAWDYAGIWHQCQEAQLKLASAIKFMAEVEEATPESDRLLKEKLEGLLTEISGALALIPK